MSKKPLNEGIAERLLTAIFDAVARKRTKMITSKLSSDPEFLKAVEDLERIRKSMEERIEKLRKHDPKFAEIERRVQNMYKL